MKHVRYALWPAAVFTGSGAWAATPVQDWHTLKPAPATVITGETTTSPTVGDTTTTSSAARIVGYFPALSLALGDQITLTYTVSFNDAVGMSQAADNWRFALLD